MIEEVSDTSRRLILQELGTGPKNVTELVEATGLKQPNVSNHLGRLRARGVVRTQKLGRQVIYAIADRDIEARIFSALAESTQYNEVDAQAVALAFAKVAVHGDEDACTEIMEQVFRAKMPVVDIYQEVLGAAMAHVGAWCKEGKVDIAQEHMASCVTERMMAYTVRITGPLRRHNRTAILGCAPNGWHVIGLRMIADYLRFCGWKTLYLGANVPHLSFVTAVTQQRPDLVLLSCGSVDSINETLTLVSDLRQIQPAGETVIGVGGRCVNENESSFLLAGAHFTARDLRDFAIDYLPEIERSGKASK